MGMPIVIRFTFYTTTLPACVLGILLGLPEQSHGQSNREVQDLLTNVAAEHERFVQYTVHCTVEGNLENLTRFRPGWKTNNQSKTEVYCEYSRIDQHYVTVVKDVNEPSPKWRLQGVSGDLGLNGSSGGKLQVRTDEGFLKYLARDPDKTKLLLFDPLSVGLVFCDFLDGISAETQLSYSMGLSPKISSTLTDVDGLITWKSAGDTTIVFDKKKSFWPVLLEYTRGGKPSVTWDIGLGRFEEHDVPVRALLKCNLNDEKQAESITKIEFKWESINVPIEAGVPSVKRLAEKFGMTYE